MKSVMVLMSCFFVASSLAVAEDGAGYFEDFPVVLSASRLIQTTDEAPAAVTVIDREMIKASGVRDVVDLFRLVPGMVVGQYKSHQATVGFNGFTDPFFRQLQVLVDGVSIYSAAWGGAEWSELPLSLDDIERIEVVRGPNAATFGSNSFLGVVNIITRDPALDHGTQWMANYGENGIRDVHVRHSLNEGDLRYRLTVGQRADHGLDSYPDSRRLNFLNLRTHYQLDPTNELRLQSSYSGAAQESGNYDGDTDSPRTAHLDSGFLQLRWTHVRGSEDEFWVQLSHAQRSIRDTAPYTLILPAVPPLLPATTWDYPVSYSYERRRTDLELQHTTRLDEYIRGVWGGQVRSDGVRSLAYFGSDEWQTSDLYRVFGNIEWRPASAWIVAGGAMLEGNSITGSSISPSLALTHEFLPGHSVRVRYARARRTPTLYEAEANWGYPMPAALQTMLSGTPYANLRLAQGILTERDVQDERISSRELSYYGKLPTHHLALEAHWFDHRLADIINLYNYRYPTLLGGQNGLTRGFDNLNSARILGNSCTIRWEPAQGTSVYFAGSRVNIRADGPGSDLLAASGPRYTASMLLSHAWRERIQLGLGYFYVGAMSSLSGGDYLPRTERVMLRMARNFPVGSAKAEAALTVQQAIGEVETFRLVDLDRRTAWLSMRVDY